MVNPMRSHRASESTRTRMEESLPNHHEDHIAGQGHNSLQHCNLVYKFPMPEAMKISRSKGSRGQGMGKIGENFGVELNEESEARKSDR